MSVEKYRSCNVDKKGQKSIVDTAIDTFIRNYRRYRYRYIKSIVDTIDIDIDIRYYQPCFYKPHIAHFLIVIVTHNKLYVCKIILPYLFFLTFFIFVSLRIRISYNVVPHYDVC